MEPVFLVSVAVLMYVVAGWAAEPLVQVLAKARGEVVGATLADCLPARPCSSTVEGVRKL